MIKAWHIRVVRTVFLLAVLLLLASLVSIDHDLRYNTALRGENTGLAGMTENELHAIEGWRAYGEGDMEAAEQAFAARIAAPDSQDRLHARFMLAELYVRKAVALETSDKPDAKVPLLELAKSHYRAILREDNSNWPARYNLARVLHLQPDTDLQRERENDVMPERSPEAPVETNAYERLP